LRNLAAAVPNPIKLTTIGEFRDWLLRHVAEICRGQCKNPDMWCKLRDLWKLDLTDKGSVASKSDGHMNLVNAINVFSI
jgi:hypothetical protein